MNTTRSLTILIDLANAQVKQLRSDQFRTSLSPSTYREAIIQAEQHVEDIQQIDDALTEELRKHKLLNQLRRPRP